MKRIFFDDYSDMATYMIASALDGLYVSAVLFPEDAMELTREILIQEDIKIGSINLAHPEYTGYEDEYYVELDNDMELNVEPAKNESGEYLGFLPDLVLIHNDAHHSVVKDLSEDKCKEVYIKDNKPEITSITEFLDNLFKDVSCDDYGDICIKLKFKN